MSDPGSNSYEWGSPESAEQLKIQVISDLHQERPYNQYSYQIAKQPGADYLFLPGDIGSVGLHGHPHDFKAWLGEQCQQYIRIFWVLGNNEVKGTSWENAVRIGRS